ncbi:TonB family protein [Pseudaminobacter sp. 19-2017]|uniref:Protein TonB n=1 Tax=Pseudaminobacter soli (ex Zhang et al. 2022) TaxID=2831468 RepID=A0A942E6R6_9HYPH|nr:TonB family protein [Pseudaminobacter soli]
MAGWLVAGLAALGLHAGVLWAAHRADANDSYGDLPEAVTIELAPLPAEPEPIEENVAEVPEPADPAPLAEPEPEPIPDEITEAPEPIPQPEPEPTLQPQPEPAPQPERGPQPVPEKISDAPAPNPVLQPQEAPVPAEIAVPAEDPAEPEVADLVTPEKNAPLPLPRPEPTARPEPIERAAERSAPAERPARKEAQKAPPPAAKAASARASQARPKVSAGAALIQRRQAPAVSPARWQSKLVSYLNRHKRYPRAARSRREEGTAQLAFTIDASGRVLSARITRSSGSAEIDGEVLAMIRRASPLPAPPAEIARSRMDLSVPISFSLR